MVNWQKTRGISIPVFLSALFVAGLRSPAFSADPDIIRREGEVQGDQPTADDIANAVKSLSSKAPAERNRSILKLFTYTNRGYLTDLENKASLFAQARASTDVGFAYKLSCLLARLPKDQGVVTQAEKALGEHEPSQIVAALAYLERYSPASVEGYFKKTAYSDLSAPVKGFFHSNPHLVRLRDTYVAATLEKYLAWVPSKEMADQPNPFREPLLKEGSAVPSYIAANKDRFARPQVPIKVVWLLGEIGSPACFDMLLNEYQDRPNYRTAVSLAACTGSLQIEQLADSLKGGKLRAFLKYILSQEAYGMVKDFDKEQSVEYWRKHFTEIRKRCVQLSRPQLG